MPLRGDAPMRDGGDVMLDNPGPSDVWVIAGDVTAVATTAGLRVPANSLQPYRIGSATHLSICCAAGLSQAVVVHVGVGQ